MSTGTANEAKLRRRNKGTRAGSDQSASSAEGLQKTTEPSAAQPLKPRPRLFFILLGVLALWIAALIFLYFDTVYPQLHHQIGGA